MVLSFTQRRVLRTTLGFARGDRVTDGTDRRQIRRRGLIDVDVWSPEAHGPSYGGVGPSYGGVRGLKSL